MKRDSDPARSITIGPLVGVEVDAAGVVVGVIGEKRELVENRCAAAGVRVFHHEQCLVIVLEEYGRRCWAGTKKTRKPPPRGCVGGNLPAARGPIPIGI